MTGAARDALVKKRSELAAQGQEHNLRRVDFTNVDWANHFVSLKLKSDLRFLLIDTHPTFGRYILMLQRSF